MHIFYIHQHFAVPSGSTGTRSYEFARRWVKAGQQVTLVTGHCDVSGLSVSKKMVQKRVIEGINVIIIRTSYSNRQSFLRRITSFFYFLFLSTYIGLRIKGIDVVYATSTPLTVGIPAIILKRLKLVPFVFEVRDQWPEIPIGLGIIKNKVIVRLLLWLERTIYKQSSAIVALSPGMADGIRSVLGAEKPITVIPNSSDTDVFRPDIDGSMVRQEKGWSDKLVFLHAGAMGRANGLDFIVDVAERLRSDGSINFVLMGDGSEKERLADRISRSKLSNIEILDSVPKTRLPEFFAACDVSIVIFADYPILEHNSANKFFDSISAGKPVLLNYSGWQRQILEENEAGFGCALGNISEFMEKVQYFHTHRRRVKKMGENARRIAVEKFSRDELALTALNVVNAAVGHM